MKGRETKKIIQYRVTWEIIMLCGMFLIVNAFTPSVSELNELSSNKVVAYLINFFIADKGVLIKYGAMSYQPFFEARQAWRALTCIYLHAGFLHLCFNMIAFLFVGRILEKEIGSFKLLLAFNSIGVLDAIGLAVIFKQEISVGASAGIFGLIGILSVLWFSSDKKIKLMKRSEFVFLIFYSVASLILGLNSFVHHFSALAMGIAFGIILAKRRIGNNH